MHKLLNLQSKISELSFWVTENCTGIGETSRFVGVFSTGGDPAHHVAHFAFGRPLPRAGIARGTTRFHRAALSPSARQMAALGLPYPTHSAGSFEPTASMTTKPQEIFESVPGSLDAIGLCPRADGQLPKNEWTTRSIRGLAFCLSPQ
jgi:hypothetical protein